MKKPSKKKPVPKSSTPKKVVSDTKSTSQKTAPIQWLSQTDLGKQFGLSAIEVGHILIKAGLKSDKNYHPYATSYDKGFAQVAKTNDGKGWYLWNASKIKPIIQKYFDQKPAVKVGKKLNKIDQRIENDYQAIEDVLVKQETMSTTEQICAEEDARIFAELDKIAGTEIETAREIYLTALEDVEMSIDKLCDTKAEQFRKDIANASVDKVKELYRAYEEGVRALLAETEKTIHNIAYAQQANKQAMSPDAKTLWDILLMLADPMRETSAMTETASFYMDDGLFRAMDKSWSYSASSPFQLVGEYFVARAALELMGYVQIKPNSQLDRDTHEFQLTTAGMNAINAELKKSTVATYLAIELSSDAKLIWEKLRVANHDTTSTFWVEKDRWEAEGNKWRHSCPSPLPGDFPEDLSRFIRARTELQKAGLVQEANISQMCAGGISYKYNLTAAGLLALKNAKPADPLSSAPKETEEKATSPIKNSEPFLISSLLQTMLDEMETGKSKLDTFNDQVKRYDLSSAEQVELWELVKKHQEMKGELEGLKQNTHTLTNEQFLAEETYWRSITNRWHEHKGIWYNAQLTAGYRAYFAALEETQRNEQTIIQEPQQAPQIGNWCWFQGTSYNLNDDTDKAAYQEKLYAAYPEFKAIDKTKEEQATVKDGWMYFKGTNYNLNHSGGIESLNLAVEMEQEYLDLVKKFSLDHQEAKVKPTFQSLTENITTIHQGTNQQVGGDLVMNHEPIKVRKLDYLAAYIDELTAFQTQPFPEPKKEELETIPVPEPSPLWLLLASAVGAGLSQMTKTTETTNETIKVKNMKGEEQ